MPTPYEPLKHLEIPNDNDSLFASITLSMLLPILSNADAFEEAFERLFGDTSMREKRTTLKRELNHLMCHAIPTSLPMLIKDHLRPKLAAYCLENRMNAVAPDDAFELNALQAMIQIPIQCHQESSSSTTAIAPLSAYPEPGQCIHLLMENGYFQPLIDDASLSSALRTQLFPVHNVVALASPRASAVDQLPFKCPSFEGMLRDGLADTSIKLTTLAKAKPAVFGLLSEETILTPAAFPVATNPSTINLHELPLRFNQFKKEINAITLNPGRVNLTGALNANFQETWEDPEWNGARNGALVGVVGAASLSLFTEFALGFGVGSLLLVEALPLAVVITLVGAGIGVVGGPYAAEYGDALVRAKQHLDAEDYESAAQVLDIQFKYADAVRWARSWFLTHEHYSVAHFFRAVCAEKIGTLSVAYREYDLALASAQRADRKLTVFLSRLHKLRVLIKARQDELPTGVNREQMLDSTLLELTQNHEIGFSDLYCKLHENISYLARRCLSNRPLTNHEEIGRINQFLMFDGFFMLKHFDNGRGEFLALFSMFVQGAVLAFFHHDDPSYLSDETRTNLVLALNGGIVPEDELILRLAAQKMQQALDFLVIFKQRNGVIIQRDPDIMAGISCMENFIVNFHAHCAGKSMFLRGRYDKVTEALSITPLRAELILQYTRSSTELLNTLQRDFGRRFLSVDAWLDDILSPDSRLITAVSNTTGNTMLHLLAKLSLTEKSERILRIKAAARRLKEQCYIRNDNDETPLFTLQRIDVYSLKSIIFPNLMIKIGDELEQVDKFLENVRRDPAKSKHFLLLEGPPGTGKSDTVLQHLKARQHVVYEWATGEADDKWVGALVTRVRAFFDKAKVAARNNPTKWHLLFIDEIDAVCPQSEGSPENGRHNRQEIVTEFQKQNDSLKGINNVVLVGATNYPQTIASAMLSRAHRVLFSLPDLAAREKLLQYFFREKRVSPQNILRIAKLTSGWSARPLLSIATSIETYEVSDEHLNKAFTESSLLFQSDFRKSFPHAHVTLPVFNQIQSDDPLSSLSVLGDETREEFMRLAASLNNPSHYGEARLHTLLFGPPGGGKTTAVRTFAKSCNFTFVLVEAGVSVQEMSGLFDRAKTFNPSIIFIDEVDRITFDGSPFREFLQEQMDGFIKNNIVVIGATNYESRIAAPLMSRFLLKIYVPPFTPQQRGELFKSMLQKELGNTANVQLDQELHEEIQNSCLRLGEASTGLSVRDINNSLVIFFGDLRVKQERNPGSILCVTLSQLLTKITPKPIASVSVGRGRDALFALNSAMDGGSSLQSSAMQGLS